MRRLESLCEEDQPGAERNRRPHGPVDVGAAEPTPDGQPVDTCRRSLVKRPEKTGFDGQPSDGLHGARDRDQEVAEKSHARILLMFGRGMRLNPAGRPLSPGPSLRSPRQRVPSIPADFFRDAWGPS